jgi:hypothetical protein
MPEASTDIPPKVRRAARIIPLALAFVVVAAVAVLAWTHLIVKGPGPAADVTPQQVASGQTPPDRDAYTAEDFTEPKNK